MLDQAAEHIRHVRAHLADSKKQSEILRDHSMKITEAEAAGIGLSSSAKNRSDCCVFVGMKRRPNQKDCRCTESRSSSLPCISPPMLFRFRQL